MIIRMNMDLWTEKDEKDSDLQTRIHTVEIRKAEDST